MTGFLELTILPLIAQILARRLIHAAAQLREPKGKHEFVSHDFSMAREPEWRLPLGAQSDTRKSHRDGNYKELLDE